MLSAYTSYKCRTCKKEFVLLSEDVEEQLKLNRYLACPYCNSKKVDKGKAADSLKECMSERSYKKVRGAIRQVR